MNPLIAMLDIKAKWLVHSGDTITPVHVPHDVKTYKDLQEYVRIFQLFARKRGHDYVLTKVQTSNPIFAPCQWMLKSETEEAWVTIVAQPCMPDGSID